MNGGLDTCDGPESFEQMYPNVVDDVLKTHFAAAVRTVPTLRAAAVAGLWLGLVTQNSLEAAKLLKQAIAQGLEAGPAAVAVAKGRGWKPGDLAVAPGVERV